MCIRDSVRDLVRDGTQPPAETVAVWAEALSTTPAYLLGETDEKEKPTGTVADGLSAKERELLELFRGLSPAEQDAQLALWKARL